MFAEWFSLLHYKHGCPSLRKEQSIPFQVLNGDRVLYLVLSSKSSFWGVILYQPANAHSLGLRLKVTSSSVEAIED